jgi:hypothetical protein
MLRGVGGLCGILYVCVTLSRAHKRSMQWLSGMVVSLIATMFIIIGILFQTYYKV